MSELFGISLTYIAGGAVAVTAAIFAFVAFIAIRNPVMFKTGLRNIPRRPAQTSLIIVGLMLSTLIVTAAFGTGDTLTRSFTDEVYTILGPVDEVLGWDLEEHPVAQDKAVIPLSEVDRLAQEFKDDPDIHGFVPYNREWLPAVNARTRLNQANLRVTGFRPADLEPFGGLKDAAGKRFELGRAEIAINNALAKELDGKVGDTIVLIYGEQLIELTVKAITPNTIFGGTVEPDPREGALVNFDFLAELTGRIGSADFVLISNDGSTRGGIAKSDRVEAKVEAALPGDFYAVETQKQDLVEIAELLGNIFTSVFVLLGLFSIAAGVLLIFLIFIMLAAERKPEMGMARAVGAKRRQIVESFLAEGMGYDLGAAVVGLFAGIGTSMLMISFINFRLGDTSIGFNLQFHATPRSLIIAFCLGIIVTFIVVFLASWRASRLNIVAAIRDLPESHLPDPERATVFGYLRAGLNGMAAFGALLIFGLLALWQFPLAMLYLVLGGLVLPLAGPWIGMLRGHNFGAARDDRKVGDSLPKWPIWVGGITAVIGVGVAILVGYFLAVLIVRLLRDRKPSSVPRWLVVLGIIAPAAGVILIALQDAKRPVAWNMGLGIVGLLAGSVLIAWGLDVNQAAAFAIGLSFIALWAALTLTYFNVPARPVFTIASSLLLVCWYLIPGGRTSALTGTLNAGPEMFFVTGVVLVTAGTFIVVYNADILLPAIGAVGARFGRLYPAVKTAIAYPLTSRFRTGLTIAMIGLTMFVLSMNAALNTNFDKAFLGQDAKGGLDLLVSVNGNNQLTDFRQALAAGSATLPADQRANPAQIEAVGEARYADYFAVDIEDPEWRKRDPAIRKPEDEFRQLFIQGVDREFIEAQRIPIQFRAAGYETDAAVWAAVASGNGFAIIPASLTAEQQGFSGGDDSEAPLTLPEEYTSPGFQPFTLRVLNRTSGALTEITVIGQTKDAAFMFWPGIIVEKALVLNTFPDSEGQTFFLKLAAGVDADRYAKQVEAALLQAEAESLQSIVDESQVESRTFLELFQGFLALGLLVGIAALGVISFRAVVERRQQIGMLRAIGYKRSMVQLSFLFESMFVAISGILLGLVLGLTFAAVLFTSGEFGETTKGIAFTVPWGQVAFMVGFALVMTAIMTILPARAASRVAVAEALRYE